MSNKIYPNTKPFAHERNTNVNFNYIWDASDENWIPMTISQSDSVINQAKANIHKFGSLPSIVDKTTEETIWDAGNIYEFPSDQGESISLKSSDTNDDQEITIVGLDENFEEKTESATLNGQSGVNVSGTWTRVFRAFNNGSTDLSGDVNIYKTSDLNKIYAKILAENNQTMMSLYTIPSNYTGYLLKYHCSAQNTDSSSSVNFVIHIKTREFGKVFRTRQIISCSTNASEEEELKFPLELPPKTDIVFNKVSANGTQGSVNADFDIALI
jgi:hypothetical protein